jgi:hypothetical protein
LFTTGAANRRMRPSAHRGLRLHSNRPTRKRFVVRSHMTAASLAPMSKERSMTKYHYGWAIPVALLLGLGTAAAAETGTYGNTTATKPGMAATTDTSSSVNQLGLTRPQMERIYQSATHGKRENVPSGFKATVGAQAPSSLKLHKLPNRVANRIPAVANDRYAMLKDGNMILVNPKSRTVDAVIPRMQGQEGGA